jgi:hypothetical protein
MIKRPRLSRRLTALVVAAGTALTLTTFPTLATAAGTTDLPALNPSVSAGLPPNAGVAQRRMAKLIPARIAKLKPLAASRGILVADALSGDTAFNQRSTIALRGASTTKLATAVTALHTLGTTTRFPTRIVSGRNSREVVIVAGEWDMMLARQHGLTNALTVTSGEGHWQPHFTPLFEGRTVTIVYDNDDTGRNGAEKVARILSNVASVRICRLPGLPEKPLPAEVASRGTAASSKVVACGQGGQQGVHSERAVAPGPGEHVGAARMEAAPQEGPVQSQRPQENGAPRRRNLHQEQEVQVIGRRVAVVGGWVGGLVGGLVD